MSAVSTLPYPGLSMCNIAVWLNYYPCMLSLHAWLQVYKHSAGKSVDLGHYSTAKKS